MFAVPPAPAELDESEQPPPMPSQMPGAVWSASQEGGAAAPVAPPAPAPLVPTDSSTSVSSTTDPITVTPIAVAPDAVVGSLAPPASDLERALRAVGNCASVDEFAVALYFFAQRLSTDKFKLVYRTKGARAAAIADMAIALGRFDFDSHGESQEAVAASLAAAAERLLDGADRHPVDALAGAFANARAKIAAAQ